MARRNGRRVARSFSDDEPDEDAGGVLDGDTTDGAAETTEPDYSFEGYRVEFIDKVAFMPVTAAVPATAMSRRQ